MCVPEAFDQVAGSPFREQHGENPHLEFIGAQFVDLLIFVACSSLSVFLSLVSRAFSCDSTFVHILCDCSCCSWWWLAACARGSKRLPFSHIAHFPNVLSLLARLYSLTLSLTRLPNLYHWGKSLFFYTLKTAALSLLLLLLLPLLLFLLPARNGGALSFFFISFYRISIFSFGWMMVGLAAGGGGGIFLLHT